MPDSLPPRLPRKWSKGDSLLCFLVCLGLGLHSVLRGLSVPFIMWVLIFITLGYIAGGN